MCVFSKNWWFYPFLEWFEFRVSDQYNTVWDIWRNQMDRRGFLGATLAGLGALFVPEEVRSEIMGASSSSSCAMSPVPQNAPQKSNSSYSSSSQSSSYSSSSSQSSSEPRRSSSSSSQRSSSSSSSHTSSSSLSPDEKEWMRKYWSSIYTTGKWSNDFF